MLTKYKYVIAGLFTAVIVFLAKNRNMDILSKDNVPVQPHTKQLVFNVELDNSKRFGIIRNVFKSSKPVRENDVTIVTHMDPSRIQNVANLANTWQGPIQICVFVTSVNLLNTTMSLVNRLRNKDANTKKLVNWHLLYPVKVFGPKYEHYQEDTSFTGKKKTILLQYRDNYVTSFDEDLDSMADLNSKMGLKGSTRDHLSFYPHTIAMNAAINASKSLYFLSLDSDLTPSKNLRKKFLDFAKKHNLFANAKQYPSLSRVGTNEKTVNSECSDHHAGSLPPSDIYVIPAFMTKDETIPRTVRQLRSSVKAGMSSYFFAGVYEPSYSLTKHSEWLMQSEDAESAKAKCIFGVWYRPGYEPFVITRKSIPSYYESFSGYSQVENHHKRLLANLGYKYKVLRNVFLVHKGWKYKSNTTKQKRKENHYHIPDWKAFLGDLKQLSSQDIYKGFPGS